MVLIAASRAEGGLIYLVSCNVSVNSRKRFDFHIKPSYLDVLFTVINTFKKGAGEWVRKKMIRNKIMNMDVPILFDF